MKSFKYKVIFSDNKIGSGLFNIEIVLISLISVSLIEKLKIKPSSFCSIKHSTKSFFSLYFISNLKESVIISSFLISPVI